jgi:peroxiredoxin
MQIRPGKPVPEALARVEVLGRDGAKRSLGELWREGPVVLVYLRHFACIACTEHVAELAPHVPALEALGVKVVLIGNGAPHFIDGFIARNGIGPQVEVVTDPSLEVFRLAGMERSRASTYGPRAAYNAGRAMLRGCRQTAIEGDVLQQGGVVVIDPSGEVAYVHRDRALGDHPPTAEILEAARAVASAAT